MLTAIYLLLGLRKAFSLPEWAVFVVIVADLLLILTKKREGDSRR